MEEKILKESNFEQEVLKSQTPVLVDFWASWCGPCRMVAPVVDAIAESYSGRLTVGKVNVDEEQALAVRYGIESIPSLLLFKQGEVAEKFVGYRPQAQLEELLNKVLD